MFPNTSTTTRTIRFARYLLSTGLLILALSLGQAQIAIHPFESNDLYTGLAISEQLQRILAATAPENDVWELTETAFLKPPLVIREGYLSPMMSLSGLGGTNLDGSKVLRETLGVDIAVTGQVSGASMLDYLPDEASDIDTTIQLDMYITSRDQSKHVHIEGTLDDIADVSYRASKVLYTSFGLRVRPLQESKTHYYGTEYEGYLRVLGGLHSGFIRDAGIFLDTFLAEYPDSYPEAQRLDRALEAISEVRYGDDVALSAALVTVMQDLDPVQRIAYFEAISETSDLPIYDLWLAILRDEVNDRDGANRAFEAASNYPFGAASQIAYFAKHDVDGVQDDIEKFVSDDSNLGLSTLWALSLAAQDSNDIATEKGLLETSRRLYPESQYSYERLSFIAFDEDDAASALENLESVLELNPDSSLYWTNYGWAQYLLGDYEGSAASSLKATDLDSTQIIAYYNLGLSHAVQGHYNEALLAYDIAIRINPVVDPSGLADLEQASEDFPEEATVAFALGNLYELQGNTRKAQEAFERFLDIAPETLNTSEGEQRLEQLSAPPATFEITEDTIKLHLAEQAISFDDIHAGDRVVPAFHIATEGFELPHQLIISYQLAGTSLSQQLDIPANVVDYRVNSIPIDIPRDTIGDYDLTIRVRSSDGRDSERTLALDIKEEGSLVRQLLSRGIILRSLEEWKPFYRLEDIHNSDIDAAVIRNLMTELRTTASVADEALPNVTLGDATDLTGAQAFRRSSNEDVRNFLKFAVASTGEGVDIPFVEAYAQWLLEGAPTPTH